MQAQPGKNIILNRRYTLPTQPHHTQALLSTYPVLIDRKKYTPIRTFTSIMTQAIPRRFFFMAVRYSYTSLPPPRAFTGLFTFLHAAAGFHWIHNSVILLCRFAHTGWRSVEFSLRFVVHTPVFVPSEPPQSVSLVFLHLLC
jgi:hypothetical protein